MTRLGLLVFTSTVGGALFAPWAAAPVQACGGMFCDAGPQQMPVDQTGETILFVLDGDHVEAHIQIEYDGGDASKFAWMVPTFGVPDVEVGSFQLIENALAGTVPVYGIQNTFNCEDPGNGSGDSETGIGFISDPDGGGASSEPDGPDILLEATAGAFDFVVLQDPDAAVVMQWLADEGYAEDANAPDIIQTYLDEGAVITAFKLSHNEGVEDIHPIVLRYEGMEPCIPLRLTRIAAKDDMDVRAIFLGEERVLSSNYNHVLLNRTRLDWTQFGPNYPELVSMAVDEAGGRAWVTEYAGSSDVISPIGLEPEVLDATVFETIDPVDVVDTLRAQGLVVCTDTCSYAHDLIESVLRKYLPAPAGLPAEEFYACLSCYEGLIDQGVWDAAGFAADYRERVLDPMAHAVDLLGTWSYATRLYTRISPHEMLVDPFFEEVPGLDDVPNRMGAQRQSRCCDTVVRMPGGREVVLDRGAWPAWSDEMPWAERIEEYQPMGPPATMLNNSVLIDQLVAQHNAAETCEDAGGSTGGAGETTGDTSDTGAGGSGPVTGGTTGDSAGGSGDELLDDDGLGCACTVQRRDHGWALGLFGLVGLLGLSRGRRRRR